MRSQVKWGQKGTDGYGGKLLNHLKKITVGLELQNFVILRAWGKKKLARKLMFICFFSL